MSLIVVDLSKDRKPGKWDNEMPKREHPDYEIGLFKSESQ